MFVHGLLGFEKTWSKNGQPWPKCLAEDLNQCRIMSFNYDPSTVNSADDVTRGLSLIARKLCDSLNNARSGETVSAGTTFPS